MLPQMTVTLRLLQQLPDTLPEWDGLLAHADQPTPFMRWAFLRELARQSAVPETGWTPCFALLEQGDELRAAAPLWLKTHSWGEFVFDQRWAQAYGQHGLAYYPKALVAVPFTPVPGSRLLAVDDAHRRLLAQGLMQFCAQQQLSGVHLLFGSAADAQALQGLDWAKREQPQFHWQRDPGWQGFDHFLAALRRDKRKKIQQERRQVRDAGVTVQVLEGAAITAADWDFFERCYANTYAVRGQPPYLAPGFFAAAPADWVLFIAEQGGQRVAASLLARDGGTAWGRHWGCVREIPFVHFELCYYAPIEWAIANGVDRFEGGAQGEHKMARGLLPTPTFSKHWLADERFAAAVLRFSEEEQAAVAAYEVELAARSPFRGVAA
jgi:uncharacterized protein